MCKALSFVDACTEEHFAAMSRSSPTRGRPGGGRAPATIAAPPFFRISGPSVRKTHRKKPEQKQAETGAGPPRGGRIPGPRFCRIRPADAYSPAYP